MSLAVFREGQKALSLTISLFRRTSQAFLSVSRKVIQSTYSIYGPAICFIDTSFSLVLAALDGFLSSYKLCKLTN